MHSPAASVLNRRVALIALDLDGTLLRSDGLISARTQRVLHEAEAAGITILSVTARPPRGVRQIAAETGLTGLAICSNGALLYDISTDTALEHTSLDPAVGTDLVRKLRSNIPGVRFAAELGMRYGCETEYEIAAEHSDDVQDHRMMRLDALALCEMGITKLIIQHPRFALNDLLHAVRLSAGPQVTVTHSGSDFVEVAAAGVTKALALERFCESRGISREEVVAFGDMPNDLPMLDWAGHGVAVANAHPDVLAVADEATDTNDEDGVAVVLERLAATNYVLGARLP